MRKVAMAGSILLLAALMMEAREIQAGCRSNDAGTEGSWFFADESIMGTNARIELCHGDAEYACAAVEAALAEIRRIDAAMSPYVETSLLSRMNRDARFGPVPVGHELFALVAQSIEYSEASKGAFDVTYASAGRYYDYRKRLRPDDATLEEALPAIDYRHLELDPEEQTVRYAHEGVYVDLGGIAKGYAVDRAIAVLRARGITQASVGAGGDSRILGDRRGEPWVFGVRDSRQREDMIAILPLENAAVSTSGDYERFFEADGKRFHHIIDPTTGDSAREVRSVTILGAEATATDALSTSVFVLGVVSGLDLINETSDIIVDGDGRVHVSAGLMDMAPRKTAPETGALASADVY